MYARSGGWNQRKKRKAVRENLEGGKRKRNLKGVTIPLFNGRFPAGLLET